MSDNLSEHHLKNVGERETHRVDPNHVERFRDPERLERLRPDELVDELDVQPGDHVLDVGCGDGLFLERLSDRVTPDGRVTGIDIETGMVQAAQSFVDKEDLENVDVQVSDDETIPLDQESVDRALLVNVLHEMAYPSDTLIELNSILKPDGDVLLLDGRQEKTGPDGPPIHHLIPEDEARERFEEAGFTVERAFDWDPDMYSMVWRKPS